MQFGFDIIPLCHLTSSGLTSGTTKGTFLSILKVLLLSITTLPDLTAIGLNFLLISLPTATKVISIFLKESLPAFSIVYSLPLNNTFLPASLLPSNLNSLIGNFLSSKTFNISLPTAPEAPNKHKLTFFIKQIKPTIF